jgi:hypothetical protein
VNSASRRWTLDHRADDLGGHHRRLLLDDRHLGHAVLPQNVDRLTHRLRRVHVDERGQVTLLPAQDVTDGRPGRRREKAVRAIHSSLKIFER